MIGRIGVVSHHLQSLLGAIELTVSSAFICIVGYFDAHIRETLILIQVASLKNVTNYLQEIKVQNNSRSSSFPLLHL